MEVGALAGKGERVYGTLRDLSLWEGSAGLEIGNKIQSHVPSGDDVWVKSSHTFATAREVLVARATMLDAFATVLVTVSSPVVCVHVCVCVCGGGGGGGITCVLVSWGWGGVQSGIPWDLGQCGDQVSKGQNTQGSVGKVRDKTPTDLIHHYKQKVYLLQEHSPWTYKIQGFCEVDLWEV